MRVRALAAAAAAAVITLPLGAAAAQASAVPTSKVTLVHALEVVGSVDIFVTPQGEAFDPAQDLFLDDFEFTQFVGPVDLPQGSVEVRIFDEAVATVGADDELESFVAGSEPLLPAIPLTIPDADITVVAQPTATGAPTVAVYTDDYTPTPAGQARVFIRHAAAAPPVRIAANGNDVVPSLANPSDPAGLEVPAGDYDIDTFLVGGGQVDALSTPDGAPLTLKADTVYFVYAIGTVSGQDLDLLTLNPIDVGKKPGKPGKTTAPATTPATATPATTTPATTTPATTTPATTTPVSPTTKPAIPTAVPAGGGPADWTGPLAVPALIALALAGVLAVAVTMAVRKSSAVRR